ncbi:DUF4157 domain-containing protein [candidate division KSB1 bacterium]|nr:MAG: DUF4157 domain-containing protein [candidate division KSB1 bacterium]MCE7941593.1 DUF4157 domain-containing protein [Chlorobi bacterium CHB1]MDL1875510.1 DUF4157 domain-containing protein [Cytophagia bacterium CHB2]
MERQQTAQTTPAPPQRNATQAVQPVPPQATSLPDFLEMQQTLGNQAVQRLYRTGVLQAKLKVGAPGDKYEQEADRVADQMMRMPEPMAARPGEDDEKKLHRKPLVEQISPLVQRQVADEKDEKLQRQSWFAAPLPLIQRAVPVAVREDDDKKKVQTKPLLQRQEEKEDESAQTKTLLQRQEKKEEEKPAQAKHVDGLAATVQRQEEKEDEAQTFSLQRQKEDDESAQAKLASNAGPQLQRQEEKEDEAAQTKSLLQRQEKKEEEKPAQAKFTAGLSYALQRQEEKEDESAQAMNVQRRQIQISPWALRAKPGGSGQMHASSAVEALVSHSRGGGSALPHDTRAFMEPRFGVDFSQVRVHTGTDAAQMSQDLNAQAFTVGRDIYFGNGKYNPQTSSGQQLLAHELTHVVQQGAALRAKPIAVTPAPQKIQRSPGPIANLLNKVARNIPGYTLITVIIGKNPITGEEVPRTAKNFLGGFMGLVPGGTVLFDNLNKSGAIDEAFNWLQKQVQALNITWAGIKALIAEAWDKVSIWFGIEKNLKIIKDIFAPTVTRVFNFVKSLGSKILEFIFTGVLKMIGAPVKQIMAILNKGEEVLTKIIKDPIGFVKNLIKGLIQGIGQFAKNALKHLKAGISGWLFGALSAANITLPSKFDLKGIFHLVLQILGATYQAIRAKVVKALGPKGESVVSKVEKAVEFVKELVTKGPIALWERVKDSLSNLKETVFGAIIDWVKSTIIGKAIEKLISFFNPAGALIQAVIAIYNTVKFFIERINQIREFAASVFNSIAEIASGNLGKAATAVENAIAKSIPVIISFLASLIGLGGISKKIQEIIKKIRQPIDKAIGKVVNWIVEKAKKLFGKKGQSVEEDDRWKIGIQGVLKELAGIGKEKLSRQSIEAQFPMWKRRYGFKVLRLKADQVPWVIEGEMSPAKPVATVSMAGATATGLSKDDAIPIKWFKDPKLYVASIHLPQLKLTIERNTPTAVPVGSRPGEEIVLGVRSKYWPKVGKKMQYIPTERGRAVDQIRSVLDYYGLKRKELGVQMDHVQDLQFEGPDTPDNVWPYDSSGNMSAGPRQRDQIVTYSEKRGDPPKQAKTRDLPGRYFVIIEIGT